MSKNQGREGGRGASFCQNDCLSVLWVESSDLKIVRILRFEEPLSYLYTFRSSKVQLLPQTYTTRLTDMPSVRPCLSMKPCHAAQADLDILFFCHSKFPTAVACQEMSITRILEFAKGLGKVFSSVLRANFGHDCVGRRGVPRQTRISKPEKMIHGKSGKHPTKKIEKN